MVGPGKYEMHQDMIKESVRSPLFRLGKGNKSVFISTSPRFKEPKKGHNNSPIRVQNEIGFTKQISSKKKKTSSVSHQSQRWKKLKKQNFENNLKKERSKQSFMFQSDTERFHSPRPVRLENLSKQEIDEVAKHAALFGPHQKNLYSPMNESSTKADQSQDFVRTITKVVGFNSEAPRFKSLSKTSFMPGPGDYNPGKIRSEHDLEIALQESSGKFSKNSKDPQTTQSAAFKSESRLKHSMINIVS